MYQARTLHPFSPLSLDVAGECEKAVWPIFSAIGDFWGIRTNPLAYRLRFTSFIDHRIRTNPLYADFYRRADEMFKDLVQAHGKEEAVRILFTKKDQRTVPQLIPRQLTASTDVDFVQVYVIDELIALYMALGGFRAFGAKNYCGYFGGANVPNEPIPYRPMKKHS